MRVPGTRSPLRVGAAWSLPPSAVLMGTHATSENSRRSSINRVWLRTSMSSFVGTESSLFVCV